MESRGGGEYEFLRGWVHGIGASDQVVKAQFDRICPRF